MKQLKHILSILIICTAGVASLAKATETTVYLNKNVGFNVEGYVYDQPALPCDVDINLIDQIVKEGSKANLKIDVVGTKEKIKNGIIPVVLLDIEQLSLRQAAAYGVSKNFNLSKIKVNAAILKGDNLVTANHSCAITSQDKFTMPTDKILLNHPEVEICAEAQKCLEDLSKDVIDWVKPQVK